MLVLQTFQQGFFKVQLKCVHHHHHHHHVTMRVGLYVYLDHSAAESPPPRLPESSGAASSRTYHGVGGGLNTARRKTGGCTTAGSMSISQTEHIGRWQT